MLNNRIRRATRYVPFSSHVGKNTIRPKTSTHHTPRGRVPPSLRLLSLLLPTNLLQPAILVSHAAPRLAHSPSNTHRQETFDHSEHHVNFSNLWRVSLN